MGKLKVYSKWERLPNGMASNIIQEGCLVIEGGAFRGLYNQGVLDALMQNDVNIRTVIGVSAGALAGMNYVSGQIGRSARVNLKYRHDSRYIGIKALHNSRSLLDVGFLLNTYNEYEPLNMERLYSKNRKFVAVTTNCLNGKTEYYDTQSCDYILDAIKASASMPYMTPMVDVGGTPSLDGGCSCKIGYQWALDNQFKKIVVIRTRERSFRKPEKEISIAEKFYRKYPEFAQTLKRSNINYNKQCQEIEELEQRKRIYVIAPSEHVTVGRLEKDMEKLGAIYQLGYSDTMKQIDQIKKYLSE